MQIKTALDSVLLPRTKEIEQEVATMQQEVSSVDNKSKEEQAEVEEDLARMAKLVFTFQVQQQQVHPLTCRTLIFVTVCVHVTQCVLTVLLVAEPHLPTSAKWSQCEQQLRPCNTRMSSHLPAAVFNL